MSTPGVWSDKDLDHILGGFGAVIVEREGTDTSEALAGLSKWAENISIIPQVGGRVVGFRGAERSADEVTSGWHRLSATTSAAQRSGCLSTATCRSGGFCPTRCGNT
jgi:hypothetical protein